MEPERRKKLACLEQRIGYSFKDESLLNMALTHTSYVKGDGRASAHNERLEFLGDSVLGMVTASYLYNHYDVVEGDLAKIKSVH